MELKSRILELGHEIKRSAENLKQEDLEGLKNTRLDLTLDYLEENDPEFVTLWNLNMDLLEHEKLQFHVKYESSKYFKSYSEMLFGTINSKCGLTFEKR